MPALPFKLNQDRRHRIPRQTHKVTNWPAYDASLRRRGSLTVWFTDEAIAAWNPLSIDDPIPLTDAIRRREPIFLATTAERDLRYPVLAARSPVGHSHSTVCLPLAAFGVALPVTLPEFYASHVGIPIAVVGYVFMAVRAVDIIADSVQFLGGRDEAQGGGGGFTPRSDVPVNQSDFQPVAAPAGNGSGSSAADDDIPF